jgi:hypothetical protein
MQRILARLGEMGIEGRLAVPDAVNDLSHGALS